MPAFICSIVPEELLVELVAVVDVGLLARLNKDGLLPPSGVWGATGAPGADPNIRLGDPGEGAIFRKFPAAAFGRALKAELLEDETTVGAVPKFKRSPSWLVRPPSGSPPWTFGGGNIEDGGGGLGVGRTGPTGGPAVTVPVTEEVLGAFWPTGVTGAACPPPVPAEGVVLAFGVI